MTQPHETYADTDNHGAGVPTGRTVIAFGRMLELDQAARESALATLSEDDPELARQLASLLPNADRTTLVFTDFAATASTGHAPHPLLVAGSAIGGFELLEFVHRCKLRFFLVKTREIQSAKSDADHQDDS